MADRKKLKKTQGRAQTQEELPLATQPTLKELVGWYLDAQVTQLRRSTHRCRASMLRKAAEALPERPTSENVRAWLAGRVERRELTGNSANQELKTFGHVYRYARDMRYPGLLNVIAAVKRFPVVKQKPRALPDSARDWSRCLVACADGRERAFLSVMRRLGLRPGEALALEARHVDLKRGTLTVEANRYVYSAVTGPLKTDTSAAVLRLHPETAELLRPLVAAHVARGKGLRTVGEMRQRGRAAGRFLFPWFVPQLRDLLERLRAAVPEAFPRREKGGTGATAFHAFRHTFATALAQQEMKDRDLQVLLRHKSLSSTQVYIASIRGREMPVDALEAAWKAEAAAEQEARDAQERERGQVEIPGGAGGNTTGSNGGDNHGGRS